MKDPNVPEDAARTATGGSLHSVVGRPVCTNCKHCMQLKKMLPSWLWPDEPTAWCCAGMRLAGNTEWNPGVGLPCWKMRTEGVCGPDAILFEARTANAPS